LGEVWSVLKNMVGVYRTQNIPVLADEEKNAVTEEEKAQLLSVHISKRE